MKSMRLSPSQQAAVRALMAGRDKTIRDATLLIQRLYVQVAFLWSVVGLATVAAAVSYAVRTWEAFSEDRVLAGWLMLLLTALAAAAAVYAVQEARSASRWAGTYNAIHNTTTTDKES